MDNLWSSILYALVGALIGAVITFSLTKRKFKKDLKKTPPINEKMIRAMYLQMGRKPSEAQVRQIMKTLNQGNGKKKK